MLCGSMRESAHEAFGASRPGGPRYKDGVTKL